MQKDKGSCVGCPALADVITMGDGDGSRQGQPFCQFFAQMIKPESGWLNPTMCAHINIPPEQRDAHFSERLPFMRPFNGTTRIDLYIAT